MKFGSQYTYWAHITQLNVALTAACVTFSCCPHGTYTYACVCIHTHILLYIKNNIKNNFCSPEKMAEQLETPELDAHHSSGSLQASVSPAPGDPLVSSCPRCQTLI